MIVTEWVKLFLSLELNDSLRIFLLLPFILMWARGLISGSENWLNLPLFICYLIYISIRSPLTSLFLSVVSFIHLDRQPGLPAFFDHNVYTQSVHCTLYTFLCKTMGILYTVFQKIFFFANLYTIVPYGVHNGSPVDSTVNKFCINNSRSPKLLLDDFKCSTEQKVYTSVI